MPRALPSTRQAGSAFFIILIAIFLFAALSYAVMQSGRVSQASLSQEQSRIAGQEIIAYTETIKKAVQTLRLRGCSDTQISFEGGPNGVANPSAPTDESCHVFSLSGGKVIGKTLEASYHMATDSNSGVWRYTPNNDFAGVGSNGCGNDSCAELAVYVRDLRSEICTALEIILSSDSTIADVADIDGSTSFAGAYDSSPSLVDDIGATDKVNARTAACVRDTSANNFSFYQILIAR